MSSQNNSLEEAFVQLMESVQLHLAGTTAKVVQDISKDVAAEIQVAYDDFFAYLLKVVLDKLVEEPAFLKAYIPGGEWDEISSKWRKEKTDWLGMPEWQNWHFNGLSRKHTTSKPLSVRKHYGSGQKDRGVSRLGDVTRRSSKRVATPSFSTYIQSLQQVGTTEKFFGPVSLQYEFQAPDIHHSFTPKMGIAQVNGEYVPNVIKSIQHRNRGAFAKFPTQLSVTANIEAFGVLKGLADLEWFIVDYIIKRVDPSHEKQWVKLNGTRGIGKRGAKTGRPIKPLILPLIKWHIHQALPKAFDKAVNQG